MADPKQQILDQLRQQAALQNARALVEVITLFPTTGRGCKLTLAETERTLLRTLRPQTRHLFVLVGDHMLSELHGEIHGGVEYGVQTISGTDPEGSRRRERRGFWGDVDELELRRIKIRGAWRGAGRA